MTIDERLEALTMNLEQVSREREKDGENIKLLVSMANQDGENIRGLARIAEIHQEEHKQLEKDRKHRDELLDARIEKLVSGIGAFIAAQKVTKKKAAAKKGRGKA
jgi:hypothetical protein